jgi:predicted cobalt transporter CbtA
MVRAHEGIGTLVIIAFLALTIVNVMQLRGRTIGWSRQLSFGAAGLLFLLARRRLFGLAVALCVCPAGHRHGGA